MQNKDSIELFIFDFDGTLVNLPVNWKKLKEDLRRLLRSKSSLVPLFPSLEAITKNNRELREKAWKLVEEYELDAVREIKPDFEMVELFNKLQAKGYRIVLLTLQGKIPVEKALRKLKLQRFFDHIITREETASREKQIEEMLKLSNVKPSKAIVVADRLHDISTASRLGCKTIAITGKSYIKSDYKFADVKQIVEIFAK
ncbi:MAG: HAD family hydrolase [Candidatus Bathyarchaeia archaeon]